MLQRRIAEEPKTKTLSSGQLNVDEFDSIFKVAGEGDAADTLTTINGGYEGQRIVLEIADDDNNITVAVGTDNIVGPNDFVMEGTDDKVEFIKRGSNWHLLGFQPNEAGSGESQLWPDGTAAAPAAAFADDTDTGIFRAGADNMQFTAGGVTQAGVDANGLRTLGTWALLSATRTFAGNGETVSEVNTASLVFLDPDSSNRTGVILPDGNEDGQTCILINVGASNTLQFNTTEATSNVLGTATKSFINPFQSYQITWYNSIGRWVVDSNHSDDAANGFDVNKTVVTRTGAGAVDVTAKFVSIVTDGADALTLADGFQGQEMFLYMTTDLGAATLTPSNLMNGSTLTFDDVGDSAHLVFSGTNWIFMGGTATLA